MSDASSSSPPDDALIYRGITLSDETLPPAEERKLRRALIPDPPPWRSFPAAEPGQQMSETDEDSGDRRGFGFVVPGNAKSLVNAALCLRRPLLIEGTPGSGKTTLAYAIARELGLPGPYRWSITSRMTLKDGLYAYDAIGRLQQASLNKEGDPKSQDTPEGTDAETSPPSISKYLRLGPVGMAFHRSRRRRPAVLLIDEIDKSDIDLPNDLLHLFEEGYFDIPELTRLEASPIPVLPYRDRREHSNETIDIHEGIVPCEEFPLVLMTSNEAREFPPAFMRRCLHLKLEQPTTPEGFYEILEQRFERGDLKTNDAKAKELIAAFLACVDQNKNKLATDQLLNAVYLLLKGKLTDENQTELLKTIFKPL